MPPPHAHGVRSLLRVRSVPRALRLALLFAGFFAVTLLHFAGVWHNGFYKDDYQWIADARAVQHSVAALAEPNPDNSECRVRPFQRLATAAVYAFAGADPAAYFIFGLALHALAAVLVAAFVRAVIDRDGGTRTPSWVVVAPALVFLLTRTHSSAVIWIAAQSTLLVTIALLAIAIWILRAPARWDETRRFAVTVAGFVVALYCKSTAVAFPFVYPLLVAQRAAPAPPAQRVLQTAILFVIAVAHAVFTKQIVGGVDVAGALGPAGADGYRGAFNVVHNIAAAIVGSLLAPQEYHRLAGGDRSPVWGAVVVLAVLALLWTALRRSHLRAAVVIGMVWLVAMAAPASLFDYDQFHDSHITVDRYWYTGFAGLALCLAAALAAWAQRRPRRVWFAVLVLVALGWVAWQHAQVQHDVRWFYYYTNARRQAVTAAVGWAQRYASAGARLYALNWKEDEAHVRAIGRLYFEELGVRLGGEQALRALDFSRPNGTRHIALRYDDASRGFMLHVVIDAATQAAALEGLAPAEPPR